MCFGFQVDDELRVGSDDKKDIFRSPLCSFTISRTRLVTVWSRPDSKQGDLEST